MDSASAVSGIEFLNGSLTQKARSALNASSSFVSSIGCAVIGTASVIKTVSVQSLTSSFVSVLTSAQQLSTLSVLGGLSTSACVVLVVGCASLAVLGLGSLRSERCKTMFVQSLKVCVLVAGITLGVSCLGGSFFGMVAPQWRVASLLMKVPGQLGVVHSTLAQHSVGLAGCGIAGIALRGLRAGKVETVPPAAVAHLGEDSRDDEIDGADGAGEHPAALSVVSPQSLENMPAQKGSLRASAFPLGGPQHSERTGDVAVPAERVLEHNETDSEKAHRLYQEFQLANKGSGINEEALVAYFREQLGDGPDQDIDQDVIKSSEERRQRGLWDLSPTTDVGLKEPGAIEAEAKRWQQTLQVSPPDFER